MTRVVSPPALERRPCALALLASLLLMMSANPASALQAPQDRSEQSPAQQPAAEPVLAGAQEAIDRGDFDTAATILENFLFEHPGHRDALFELAYLRTLQERAGEALDLYRQVLEVAPDFHPARMNLALILLRQKQLEEALREFEHILKDDPRSYKAQLAYATTLDELGRDDEALEHYRRAAALNPEDPEPRRAALALALPRRDWAIARQLVAELQEITPADPELHLLEAELLANLGKDEEALTVYERYLNRGDTSAPSTLGEIHMRAGWLARKVGKGEDALRHFRAAREIGGDYYKQASLQDEAETLAWLGRYREAVLVYEQATEANPGNLDLLAGLGFAYLQTRQYAKAVSPLAYVVEKEPSRIEVHNHLASALLAGGDYAAALQALDQRARWAPETPATLFLRAISYDKLGRCGPALAYYEKFLQQNPDSNSDPYFQATGRIRALRKTCRERLPAIE